MEDRQTDRPTDRPTDLGIKAPSRSLKILAGARQRASFFYAFRNFPIVTRNVLFDIGKSLKKFEEIDYDALDKMEYSKTFAYRYNSQQLKILVPNVAAKTKLFQDRFCSN